jgi:hypothetical protein
MQEYTTRNITCEAHLNVNQFYREDILAVIPGPVVQPLTKEFNGRLSPTSLFQRHVHIIHKHHISFSKRWPIYSCTGSNLHK